VPAHAHAAPMTDGPPWWADVASWRGYLTELSSWWHKDDALTGSGRAATNGNFTLAAAGADPGDGSFRWRGKFDFTSQWLNVQTNPSDNPSPLITSETGFGDAAVSALLSIGPDATWELDVDFDSPVPITGTEATTFNGTTTTRKTDWAGMQTYMFARRFEVPTGLGAIEYGEKEGPDAADTEHNQWEASLVLIPALPGGGGGGGGPEWDIGRPGGDPKKGPYSPEADNRNPAFVFKSGELPHGMTMEGWETYANNWLKVRVTKQEWAAVRETYKWFHERTDIQVEYREVLDFTGAMWRELIRPGGS
jgi:hypothetical protein